MLTQELSQHLTYNSALKLLKNLLDTVKSIRQVLRF